LKNSSINLGSHSKSVVFYDSHEFLPIGARKLATIIGIPSWLIFEIDYLLSKIPPVINMKRNF
jgi:hypothetical protein